MALALILLVVDVFTLGVLFGIVIGIVVGVKHALILLSEDLKHGLAQEAQGKTARTVRPSATGADTNTR